VTEDVLEAPALAPDREPAIESPALAVADAKDDEAAAAALLARERVALSRRRLAIGIVLGLATAALVVQIMHVHLGQDLVSASLAAHEPVYLVSAVACVIVFIVADALTTVVLARVFDREAPARPLVLLSLRATFVGGTTSFGGVEIPYQVVGLRNRGFTLSQSTAVTVVKGVAHTSILVLVGLLALMPGSGSPISPLQHYLVLTVLAVLIVVWLVGSLWVRHPIGLTQLPRRVRRPVFTVRQAFKAYHGAGWRTWTWTYVAQGVYWAAQFAIFPLILYSLGWRGPLIPVIVGQAVMQILMPLSPLAGGAGVAELSFFALIGPSMPPSIRIPTLVLWRAVTWLIPVVVGGLAFLVSGGSRGER
jgi:hypothetical protein